MIHLSATLGGNSMFSFMHTADLHLGAPFKGVRETTNRAVENALINATYRTYKNLVRCAIERQVDFIVIAGDVYNDQDRNLGARLAFQRGLQELHDEGIQVYLVHGNHDPLTRGAALQLPDNCHVFPTTSDAEPLIAQADGDDVAMLYGISFAQPAVTRNLAVAYPAAGSSSLFSIGVLHANVGGIEGHDNYAPCMVDDLIERGYDYWAMGHCHRRQVLRDSQPLVVYPGSPQGLSFRECGAHGCSIVHVTHNRETRHELVDLDELRWCQEVIDITNIQSLTDFIDQTRALAEHTLSEAQGRGVITRIRAVGRGPLHSNLTDSAVEIESDLRRAYADAEPFYWLESLTVCTEPPLDLGAIREAKDCMGALLRYADIMCESETALKSARDVLRHLLQHPLIRNHLGDIPDSQIRDWLKEAVAGALELLHGGDRY